MSQELLTFGEKAVGLNFNPSGQDPVFEIKKSFAAAIDIMHEERQRTHSQEVKRMLSKAITDAQTAQMWAVKAVTWKD